MLSASAFLQLGNGGYIKTPVSFQAFECIYRPSWYRFETTVDPSDFVKWNKEAAGNGKELLVARWVCTEAGKTFESDPKVLRLRDIEISPRSGGVWAVIVASDRRIDLRTCGQRVFKNMTLNEMVEEIADAHQLVADTDKAKTKYTLRQCRESDWDFLNKVILPRSGPEPWMLYLRDGDTLVFKKRTKKTAGQGVNPVFQFGAGVDHDAGEEQSAIVDVRGYRSRFSLDTSSYPTTMVAFDSEKRPGAPYSQTYVAGDETHPYDPFAEKKPGLLDKTPSEIRSIIVDEGLSVTEELRARSTWKAPFTKMRLVVPCSPMPKLRIGQVASFQGSSLSHKKDKLFVQGNYLIYGLFHEVDQAKKICGTTVFMERRGLAGV